MTAAGSAARLFCEELDGPNADRLYQRQVCTIHRDHLDLLNRALAEPLTNSQERIGSDGLITLKIEEVLYIRWNVVRYLDRLEALAAAWWHSVAERRMIEEQFKFLIGKSGNKQHTLLENLRKAAGGTASFPALEAFVVRLRELDKLPQPSPENPTGYSRLWWR
jgi:hypothetical protein